MNKQDTEMWADWNKFANYEEFRSFLAWALNGSCIEQRMGLFTEVPDSWHKLKPYAEKLKTYEQANMGIIDPEYLKSLLHIKSEELIHTLDAKESEFSHRVILININRLYRNDMTDKELYETTRGTWRTRADRKNPEFAIAIYQKTILEVYKINNWYEAGTLKYHTRDSSRFQAENRWEFEGEKAEESVRNQYIGLNVKRSYGNPIRYINCNN